MEDTSKTRSIETGKTPPENQSSLGAPGNPLLNILINIVFPVMILNKLSDKLGPAQALLLSLSLPLAYGAWEFVSTRKHNFISILGFVSILLTGGLGLVQADGIWFAVKEAAVPGLIACVTLASLKTEKPLIKLMLYNERVIDIARVDATLAARNAQGAFNALLFKTTAVLAASFVLSAVLNFGLAVHILKSPAGTPEFNQELARMTALSYPVIALPSMAVMMIALWMLVKGLKKITGLELQDILSQQAASPRKNGK